jgi:hypothetical protein
MSGSPISDGMVSRILPRWLDEFRRKIEPGWDWDLANVIQKVLAIFLRPQILAAPPASHQLSTLDGCGL